MDFPELLAVLLHQNCAQYIPAEIARLETLAETNGNNLALQMYLRYFETTKECPNEAQLKDFTSSQPMCTAESIGLELQSAQMFEPLAETVVFPLALNNAWKAAREYYTRLGYHKRQATWLNRYSGEQ